MRSLAALALRLLPLLLARSSTAICGAYDIEPALHRRQTSQNPDTPSTVSRPANVSIAVVWHRINNGTHGLYPDETVDAAIALLNEAYAPAGFGFHLQRLSTVTNDTWLRSSAYDRFDSPSQQMRMARREGTNQTLNVYAVDFPGATTGYSTFPFQLRSTSNRSQLLDGVVLDWKRLPGVEAPRVPGSGALLVVHEVGHWLGLDHPFYGGCNDPSGDRVDDTPPSARPAGFNRTGCGLEETCPGRGPDVTWRNPMSYNRDECLTAGFTPGQIRRIHFFMTAYRGFSTCEAARDCPGA